MIACGIALAALFVLWSLARARAGGGAAAVAVALAAAAIGVGLARYYRTIGRRR